MTRAALIAIVATGLAGCASTTTSPDETPLSTVLRGHDELEIRPSGAHPVSVDNDALGLCLAVDANVDTTTWRGRLWVATTGMDAPPPASESEDAWQDPTARTHTTLCFDLAEDTSIEDGAHQLCGEIHDSFDGSTRSLACQSFRRDATRAVARSAAEAALSALLRRRGELGATELADGLLELAERVEGDGRPLLALRARLIASYMLRQGGDVARAEALLSDPPAWLSGDTALRASAHFDYEAALVALDDGRRAAAWERLESAEHDYQRIAHRSRIVTVMKQAGLLSRTGAGFEARQRLRTTLDDCKAAPCNPDMVVAARNTLGWLVLQDPVASDDELEQLERELAATLKQAPAEAHLDRANEWLTVAYARARRGLEVDAPLKTATEHLRAARRSGTERRAWLEGWSRAIAATADLAHGRLESAYASCGEVATSTTTALAAFASTCRAEAARRLGDLEEAQLAIVRAIELYEREDAAALGQATALGPGQRADAHYEAARLAAARDRPGEAWDWLRRLDRSLASHDDVDCTGLGRGGSTAGDDAGTRRQLEAQLAALEGPASEARTRELQPIRRRLKRQLALAARREAVCRTPAAGDLTLDDDDVDVRAVALRDEILLLVRDSARDQVRVRRTAYPRGELVTLVDRIGRALDGDDATLRDDDAWQAALSPLADALVPDHDLLGPLTTFATHGLLQRVPLTALPLSDASTTGHDAAWLGQHTAVVRRPAAAWSHQGPATDNPLAVFVLDPERNLPSARDSRSTYERLFPSATLLVGDAATRSAWSDVRDRARWLHVDAHAEFDPAFPELSRLRLADGPIHAAELAAFEALELANLSACGSSRYGVTADSGRYGLAGALARAGVRWVVGAASDLDDTVALDFNRAFYDALANGATIPQAYVDATSQIADTHTAARWASIELYGRGRTARASLSTGLDADDDRLLPGRASPESVRAPQQIARHLPRRNR